MATYKATIGLEIHAELKTRTKMFCDSKNDPEEKRPNVNVCPVCMAHPGTLPVINKEAVRHILRVGKALGGTRADFTEFDRKNYFYPDIPKGYQISQYKYPLVSGGSLEGVAITRVHLEEDTARSTHDKGAYSLVDYNRAGVPLMELVTEPVIEDAETAIRFARELQLLLRTLGASDANMEKGEMRVEANVSVLPYPDDRQTILRKINVEKTKKYEKSLGTKVEVKNLNSFRVVGKAITYEIARQTKALERGEKVIQETRGWDEKGEKTFSQRTKETSEDYRYFPDPDLPKLYISRIPQFQDIELPELPREKRARYRRDFGIKDEDIESYVANERLGAFFEDVTRALENDKKRVALASNYITSDLLGLAEESDGDVLGKITPENFAALIVLASDGSLSSRGAKDALKIMAGEGGDPKEIAEREGLMQKSDEEELTAIVEKVIADNPSVAEDYKKGKKAALQFLVGQGMKATKGSANPNVLKELFIQLLA